MKNLFNKQELLTATFTSTTQLFARHRLFKLLVLLLFVAPKPIFGNDEKIPSKIKDVTVYLSGASITRTATCSLASGATEITLAGLSSNIDESSIQISGLQSVSILSMSYDINYIAAIEDKTVLRPLQDRLDSIALQTAILKNTISGLEEEEQVIYANRKVNARTQGLNLERLKEISTYYRNRITAIKNEIFTANREIQENTYNTKVIQKQLAELNNSPEKEQGEIKIKFDAPVATKLNLIVNYQVQDAGWIPNYDIKSKDINAPLFLSYKAHVFQKTGNDWNNVNITLSTGNPKINVAKPIIGPKYLNFTNGYKTRSINVAKKQRYVYNPSVKRISGIVIDDSGSPLPGASIVIKGTSTGTQTDFDGHFSIDVQNGQELAISYIGFNATVLPIYSSIMNIQLEENLEALDEVVVTGYGTQQHTAITGAVATINNTLAGKTAGIQIRGTSSLNRRSQTSIKPSPSPLYIVDGVFAENYEEGDLDMDEIQSVEVLKGNKATAIYGSRGANGIIVVTTKKSTTKDDVTQTKFIIKKPYTIVSDGDISAIEINTFVINATYEYFAAPIVNENVFLTTTFSNWEQYNLLPGEASVYFKGAYAGKTTVDPFTTKKEMTVSLGIDQNITVTRNQNKNFKSKSFSGSNRILNRIYDLEIKNNKANAINIRLVDRIPISQQKEIKVDDIETNDAEYDNKKGVLVWKLKMQPQETLSKQFSFQVKYPKLKRITI